MDRRFFITLGIFSAIMSLTASPTLGSITMYNGRPGARLVMHLYPGDSGFIRTSTIGQPYPGATAKRQFFIINKEDGKLASMLPLASDPRLAVDPVASQEWGLECNGFTTKSGITFKVRSPFLPVRKLGNDFSSRATTAPLFLLEVIVRNPSDKPITGRMLVGMDHAIAPALQKGCRSVSFQDLNDSLQPAGGELRLAGASDGQETLLSKDLVGSFLGGPEEAKESPQGGLIWKYRIPAKKALTRRFIFAGYTSKTLFHDSFNPAPLRLNYTMWWKDSTEVAEWGVQNIDKLSVMSERLEESSGIRGLDQDHRFVISQAVAEHLSDTHLLTTHDGHLIWMYSEAGFSAGYLSTVDLIPDTFLLNKEYFPWTLDLLVRLHSKYIVHDGLGVYVTHDVGASDFETRGNYGESGAGHRMPVEEICNYIHLLWLTWKTDSEQPFLQEHAGEMVQLLNSLVARDANGDGIPDSQSNLAESNTFDNGALIGTTKNNTYLGLKVWTSARFLAEMLSEADKASSAARAADLADRAEKTLLANEEKNGYFWTILDPAVPNHEARSLWLTKGMLTPYIGGFDFGPHKSMEASCEEHVRSVAPLLKRDCGYAFDSVPTSRVTWQSQSLMVDLLSRNYWGSQDLSVAKMMARSGRVSGVLNEFVGPKSGLAKDTEWPLEQVYSRMASAVGWLPGVMPKPVHRTPVLLRWTGGADTSSHSAALRVVSIVHPQWRSGVLPPGKYYVKLIGDEAGLLSKRTSVYANGVRLSPARQSALPPTPGSETMLAAVVPVAKPASVLVKVQGIGLKAISLIEISSEPTSTRLHDNRPSKLSVEISAPRLRADGKDSLTITARLCDSDDNILKLDDIPVSLSLTGCEAEIIGGSEQKTVAGVAAFGIRGGTKTGNMTLTISSGRLQPVQKELSVGGDVSYLLDVGRDAGAVMDSRNRLWLGDSRYDPSTGYGYTDQGGDSAAVDNQISKTADPKIYQTYRWSPNGLAYRFDTYEPGDYLVRLLFTETFFGTQATPGPGEGRRIIDATINGKQALTGFDILKAAGGPNTAVDRSFIIHLDRPEPIVVRLTAEANCASLAGIEVHPVGPDSPSAVILK